MNPFSVDTFLTLLILANAFMGLMFIIHQRQGKSFVASFNKSTIWEAYLFTIGYFVDSIIFVA